MWRWALLYTLFKLRWARGNLDLTEDQLECERTVTTDEAANFETRCIETICLYIQLVDSVRRTAQLKHPELQDPKSKKGP